MQKQIDELHLRGEPAAASGSTSSRRALVKDYFRNAPLLDFMAPTLKVQQIILPNVVDDVNFTRVPKMDRCKTCHLAIDRAGYEKYPQPFTTHPNLATYLGSASPHPIDQVGCTVCHEGHGPVGQLPRRGAHAGDAKQKKEWEEKFDWEEPHLWDYPMLPTKMTEASCAKCHKQEVYVPNAEKLNVAYATYERAGCYACHKTRGFENLRKPGPILTKIDSKLTPDWVKTWIRNPRRSSRRPGCRGSGTTRTPARPRTRSGTKSRSTPPSPISSRTARSTSSRSRTRRAATRRPASRSSSRSAASAATSLDEKTRAEAGPHRTFGQPLQNIGNKTTYEWIYNWVRDPKHYSPATYMPNLRLTDAQVADVATYLSALKDSAGGDQAKATPDQAAVDAVLLDY